jgi:hypothetical protein
VGAIQRYSRGRFEFFVVATVIALIALVALDRYTLMAKDTQVLRLQIISQHFMTAAANLRVEFLVAHVAKSSTLINKGLLVDGKFIYMSDQGWPGSFSTPVTDNFQPTENDCYQLWKILLQNPPPIAFGQRASKFHKYRVATQPKGCRYTMIKGEAYFDYFPLTGRVLFSAVDE